MERNEEAVPVLWKEDKELGIAYFCPHCKIFQCTGRGPCTECEGNIEWNKKQRYKGVVRFY